MSDTVYYVVAGISGVDMVVFMVMYYLPYAVPS